MQFAVFNQYNINVLRCTHSRCVTRMVSGLESDLASVITLYTKDKNRSALYTFYNRASEEKQRKGKKSKKKNRKVRLPDAEDVV